MPKLIDLEKIKPIDFPSTEMDGLDVVRYLNTLPTVDAVEVVNGHWISKGYKGICEHCAYREDCEWPKLHPKIKLKECPDFNKGDKK